MKRILMLAAAGAAIAASVAVARRRRGAVHAAELAGSDVIIDEVIIHFDLDDGLLGSWSP